MMYAFGEMKKVIDEEGDVRNKKDKLQELLDGLQVGHFSPEELVNLFRETMESERLLVTFDTKNECTAEHAVFFPLQGSTHTGDDNKIRIIRRKFEYIIDASRPRAVSQLGIPENNMNQLLHLLFMNTLNIPQATRVEQIYPCKRTIKQWLGRHREVHGFEVRFESFVYKCTFLDVCTKREVALQFWSQLSVKHRAACHRQSAYASLIPEELYVADEMIAIVHLDFINDLIKQTIAGQIRIQSAMDSVAFLTLENTSVVYDNDALFGAGIKFWPSRYSTFSVKIGDDQMASVFPHTTFGDRVPLQNPFAVGMSAFLVDLFVTGTNRLDDRNFGDFISEFVASTLKSHPHESKGFDTVIEIATQNKHAQAYDVMRIAYELMFVSPTYKSSKYRSDSITIFDTPILSRIFSAEEIARLYYDGKPAPQLAYFRVLTGDLLMNYFRRRNADRLVQLIKEPSFPISMELKSLVGDEVDAENWHVLEDSAALKTAIRRAAEFDASALDLGIKHNILERVLRLINQGAIGKLYVEIEKLAVERSVPGLSSPDLTRHEIARGGGGAVFRVRNTEYTAEGESHPGAEYAMKIPLHKIRLKPSKHTNRRLANGSTEHTFTNDVNFNELIVTAMCSQLYDSGKSPHFIQLMNGFVHEQGIALVMEKIHGDMFRADKVFTKIVNAHIESGVPLEKCPTFTQLATNVTVQTIFALHQFQNMLSGMHNDFHLANIFLKICDDTLYDGRKLSEIDFWTYETEFGKYKVPNLGILVKIGDFGLSTIAYDSIGGQRIVLASHRVYKAVGGHDTFEQSEVGKGVIDAINKVVRKISPSFNLHILVDQLSRGVSPILDRNVDYLMFFRHMRLHPRFQQLLLVQEQKIFQAISRCERIDPQSFTESWSMLLQETTSFTEVHFLLIRWLNKSDANMRSLMAEVQTILLAATVTLPPIGDFVRASRVMSYFDASQRVSLPAVPLTFPTARRDEPQTAAMQVMRAEYMVAQIRERGSAFH